MEVHEVLNYIGGEVTYTDDSPDYRGQRETVYWTLVDTPTPLFIRAVWVLYYDSEDRLTEVVKVDS
jgi:hypothetical protein